MTAYAKYMGVVFDEDLHRQGYFYFQQIRSLLSGQIILFQFGNGVRYYVESRYIPTWYSAPFMTRAKGRWIENLQSEPPIVPKGTATPIEDVSIITLRRLIQFDGVVGADLYFSNGKGCRVLPLHVLMYCEPQYEFFSGFFPDDWPYRVPVFKLQKRFVRRCVCVDDLEKSGSLSIKTVKNDVKTRRFRIDFAHMSDCALPWQTIRTMAESVTGYDTDEGHLRKVAPRRSKGGVGIRFRIDPGISVALSVQDTLYQSCTDVYSSIREFKSVNHRFLE